MLHCIASIATPEVVAWRFALLSTSILRNNHDATEDFERDEARLHVRSIVLWQLRCDPEYFTVDLTTSCMDLADALCCLLLFALVSGSGSRSDPMVGV